MVDTLITVAGLEDVQQMLAEAPRVVVASGFLKAASAAGSVIQERLLEATPERDEGERNEDDAHLIDSSVVEITLDSRYRGVQVKVGFGKLGHRALWVEYGHVLLGHKPGKKRLGDVLAHPFMRPAADASAESAIAAFANSLAETVRNEFPQGGKP